MLANWMFFWDEADWIPAPEPEPTVTDTPSSGGSGGKRKNNEYTRAGDYFWELRERYLRRLQEPPNYKHAATTAKFVDALPSSNELIVPAQQPITFYQAVIRNYENEKDILLGLAKLAASVEQLRIYGSKVREVNRVIFLAKAQRKKAQKLQVAKLKILGEALIALLRQTL